MRISDWSSDVCSSDLAMFGYIQLGDQHAPQQIMGPLVSARQRARVLDYIEIGKREGARLVCGGGKPAHLAKGWWVEPTLFADVRNDMRIARERSEEHTSELQSLMRISYAVFCLKKKNKTNT